MKAAPRPDPRCVRCTKPREIVEGFIAVHVTGLPTYICFGCIDDLKVIAEHYRAMEAGGG